MQSISSNILHNFGLITAKLRKADFLHSKKFVAKSILTNNLHNFGLTAKLRKADIFIFLEL